MLFDLKYVTYMQPVLLHLSWLGTAHSSAKYQVLTRFLGLAT